MTQRLECLVGMCQKCGKSPATARGVWTCRGVMEWNHTTEFSKLLNESRWHQDGAVEAAMAEQAQPKESVLELHFSASVKQVKE